MSAWVQPNGDESRRVVIPHATAASEEWSLDGTYVQFEGRTYPVGARGEYLTTVWSLSAIWGAGERAAAEAFLDMLREVSIEPDGRVAVHVGDPVNGTPIEFVGKTNDVPQTLAPGVTTVDVTFTQVES